MDAEPTPPQSTTVAASTRSATPGLSPEAAALAHEQQVADLVGRARSTLRRGQRDETRKLLQQIFALSPSECGALELLGDIFLEEGEQEKAIAVFERGRSFHPRHAAFEEKIALAKIDQQEEELDKIRRETALQLGDTEAWRDRKPGVAAFLSLVLPGAGHVYLERYERAAAYFAAWLITLCGWYFPLRAALPTQAASAALKQSRNALAPMTTALSSLSGFSLLWFWLMMLLHLGVYVVSAIDASQSAKRATELRKRELGL